MSFAYNRADVVVGMTSGGSIMKSRKKHRIQGGSSTFDNHGALQAITKVIHEPVMEISCYAISFKILKKNVIIHRIKSFCEVEEMDNRLNILIKLIPNLM